MTPTNQTESSPSRKRRRPAVSCEPCRTRKIRCSRDAPPCSTCTRRRVPASECIYNPRGPRGRRAPQSNANEPSQSQEIFTRSEESPSETQSIPARNESNAGLVSRIEHLERLLHAAGEQTNTIRSDSPTLGSDQFNRNWQTEPPTTFATGTLIPSTSGHVRFLPFSSSWRLVHGASQGVPLPDRESTVTNTPSGPFPFGEHEAEKLPNLLAKLPPTGCCDQLKDLYFQSLAPIYPVLHSPSFHEQYEEFSQNPEQARLEWLALLFTILGTAVLALGHNSPLLESLSRKSTPWDRVTDLSERYYTAAMKCLEADHYLWRHNVTTLQALLILIYGIQHSHGHSWTLLGLAYHLAISIGCHVDPAAFSLDVVVAEERRRCWLALITLLCNQNTSMTGFDMNQTVSSSRVQHPAGMHDDDITRDRQLPIAESAEMTPVSYLVWKFRLFRISSEICDPLLLTQPDDLSIRQRLDAVIRAELDPLEKKYAAMVGTDPSIVHVNLLLSLAHHLVLLLHSGILNEAVSDLSHHEWSKKCCTQSAQRVLELHADFSELPQFVPFHWYIRGRGAFYAFHAAFILFLIISLDPEKNCPLKILRLLHECHARLEASRMQSQLCARTATTLRHMLSSRVMSAASSMQVETRHSVPVSHDSSSAIPNTDGQIDRPLIDSSSADPFIQQPIDFSSLVRHIEPQQWTDPFNMDWDHWDAIMASLGTQT